MCPASPASSSPAGEDGDAGQAGRRAGPRRSPSVAAEHHADDRGDEEGAERPAVPGQPVELGDRGRHRRPDGHRLEGDEGDEHQQADGRAPVGPVEDPAVPLVVTSSPTLSACRCFPSRTCVERRPPRGPALDAYCAVAQPLRAVICSVAAGTTVFRSPTTPKSASSKIGASGSLLMATMVFEVCMPARCWIAPEMPTAM